MASIARKAPAFKLGKKQVFLPGSTIAMINRPKQDPSFATFKVPLRFTKFDLRDYLWNLYKVEVTKVRSFVAPSPVINSLTENAMQRARIHRGSSEKYMTVELKEPFAWPELPADLEPWNKKLWDARTEYSRELNRQQVVQGMQMTMLPSEVRMSTNDKHLAKQARALLSGEAQWTNGEILDVKWEKAVKEAEAEAPLEDVTPAEVSEVLEKPKPSV